MSAIVDEIFETFRREGDSTYLGEPVTLTEHMLQSATAAEDDAAPPELVAAAVLHDFGHLVHDLAPDSAEHGVDTLHEDVGSRYLERHFPAAVTEPIRLHVASKRYLCAVEPEYLDERLRRYDDIAKVPGARTPPLEHYRSVLEAVLVR
jgi:predicted HD phosphohydrolase